MTKSKFKNVIDEGIGRGKNFMVVKIETEGNPAPAIIINPAENFPQILNAFLAVCDDDMELISAKASNKSIRIIDVLMTSNLSDLSWFVF